MKVRTNEAGIHEARCTRCATWKPADQENFYYSTEAHALIKASGEQVVKDQIARAKSFTSLLRSNCRECERNRTPGTARAKVETYPKTRYCPAGHGAHTFNSETEERLIGTTCKTCGAEFVSRDPSLVSRTTRPIDLPELPAMRHDKLQFVVSALQAGRHVYLAGTPGTGKSELARQAAEALGLSFGMIACDSSMTRSTLMGLVDAGGTYHRTALRDAVEHGGVFLIDEMDNGNPSLLAALNSAMANGLVAFPDESVAVHDDFRVIATANTWGNGPTAEFVGRLKVDPATLDRFVRISVDIDERLERELTIQHAGGNEAIAETVLDVVRGIRAQVAAQGVKVIISPRASMQVAALAAQGWSVKDAVLTTAVGTLDPRMAAELMRSSR